MLTRELLEGKFDFCGDLNTTEFEYDADNKLVFAEKYKDDALVLKARYDFDGLGRRIEKEVVKGSVVSRKSYIYNGDDILLEFDTTGATPIEKARYIGTGAIDDNLVVIKNGKSFFYHKDHLGSIISVTNDAGEVVQKNYYSSFGKIVSVKDKNRNELALESATEKTFFYTGREYDSELEMYYYRNRTYDPQIGRFIQKDPIGLAAGDTNLYRYVQNKPLNFVDPFGLDKEDIFVLSGTIPHSVTRIYDPQMPGNDVYVEFGPVENMSKIEAFRRESFGEVIISSTRPDYFEVKSFISKGSPSQTSRMLTNAQRLQVEADSGSFLYKAGDFNLNDKHKDGKKVTNCFGFSSGL